jgi:hypothetical protein
LVANGAGNRDAFRIDDPSLQLALQKLLPFGGNMRSRACAVITSHDGFHNKLPQIFLHAGMGLRTISGFLSGKGAVITNGDDDDK